MKTRYSDSYGQSCIKVLPLLSFYQEMLHKAQNILLDKKLVLDIGSGPGILAEWMKETGTKIVCMDSDALLLRGLPIEAVSGSAETLPFKGKSFDAVTALNLLPFIENCSNFMKEINRVTSEEGSILITGIKKSYDMSKVFQTAQQDLSQFVKDPGYQMQIQEVMNWNKEDLQKNLKNLFSIDDVCDLVKEYGYNKIIRSEHIYLGQSYFIVAKKG